MRSLKCERGGLPKPRLTKELLELKWLQGWKLLGGRSASKSTRQARNQVARSDLGRSCLINPCLPRAYPGMSGGLLMCECSERILNHQTKVRNRQCTLRDRCRNLLDPKKPLRTFGSISSCSAACPGLGGPSGSRDQCAGS